MHHHNNNIKKINTVQISKFMYIYICVCVCVCVCALNHCYFATKIFTFKCVDFILCIISIIYITMIKQPILTAKEKCTYNSIFHWLIIPFVLSAILY